MAEMQTLARITAEEYRKMHAYAAAHDVRDGGKDDIYDAPSGGAINVWGRGGWQGKQGHIHCSFYMQREDGEHPGLVLQQILQSPALRAVGGDSTPLELMTAGSRAVYVLYEPGTHGGKYGLPEDQRWGEDRDWTAEMALGHLCELFRQALGYELDSEKSLQ